MDAVRYNGRVIFLLSCFIVVFLIGSSTGDGGDVKLSNSPKDQDQSSSRLLPVIDVAKSLFSRPPSCDDWLLKIRAFLHQRWCFYFPLPNLDFRRGRGEDEVGSKDKVKDAVMKSLDTSKSAFEDSAKSAAKLAEDAMDKTVDKLKRTLSGSEDDHNTRV